MFTLMFCVHLCLLNKHKQKLCCRLFPDEHCVLPVIIVRKRGAGTLSVFILNRVRMKGLDDRLVVHLNSKYGDHRFIESPAEEVNERV